MREHIVSPKIYYAIFIALVVLTVVTWSIAKIDLGRMNAVVALTIAVILQLAPDVGVRWSRLLLAGDHGGFDSQRLYDEGLAHDRAVKREIPR